MPSRNLLTPLSSLVLFISVLLSSFSFLSSVLLLGYLVVSRSLFTLHNLYLSHYFVPPVHPDLPSTAE